MKRIFAIILAVLLIAISLCGCGEDNGVKGKIESGDFEEAIEMINRDYEYKKSEEGSKYLAYAEGMVALEEGLVTVAYEKLSGIEGFMDVNDKLLEIERFFNEIDGRYQLENYGNIYYVELEEGNVTLGLEDEDDITIEYNVFSKSLSTSGSMTFSAGNVNSLNNTFNAFYDLTLDSSRGTLFVATAEGNSLDAFAGTYTKK